MTASLSVTSPSSSRRAILAGALGGIGAWAMGALGRAAPLRATGDDGAVIHVGDTFANVQSQTTLGNQVDNGIVLWVASNADSGGGGGIAVHGHSVTSTGVEGQSTSGYGVRGISGSSPGVHGSSTSSVGVRGISTGNYGVYGSGGNSGVRGDGATYGVRGDSPSGYAVFGASSSGTAVHGESGSGDAIHGFTVDGAGVSGQSTSAWGVRGDSDSYYGVEGVSNSGIGVSASSTSNTGLVASSTSGTGVSVFSGSGVGLRAENGSATRAAVRGHAFGSSTGVVGYSGSLPVPAAKAKTGVFGYAGFGSSGKGVWGQSPSGRAIQGSSSSGYAGYFSGKVFTNAFYELAEIANPAAPGSNRARLFIRDNGVGKSQLCIRYTTGAIQVLNTQP